MSDIDYSLFSPASIRKSVEAIRDRPKLTRDEVRKLERQKDNLMARFEEVSTIRQPLEESYVSVRRKLDPKYDPDKDRNLQEVNRAGGERYKQLLSQFEPLHDTQMRVLAAKEALRHLAAVLNEVEKLCDVVRGAVDTEKSPYLPPYADPENN